VKNCGKRSGKAQIPKARQPRSETTVEMSMIEVDTCHFSLSYNRLKKRGVPSVFEAKSN
jgi:hypothetical protein